MQYSKKLSADEVKKLKQQKETQLKEQKLIKK